MDPVLELRGVNHTFGGRAVLHGLDLTVGAGQIYGFLGRNGAGKTTTLRVVTGLIAPTGGSIVFGGQTVIRTTTAMRREIGYVAQQQSFDDGMTARQLGWFVGAFYPRWDAALYAALLKRLEVPENQRAGQLSGGTRLKLALALALAPKPLLVVLDEPTSGIDPLTRREIFDILRAESGPGGQSVLFSTHNIGDVEALADVVGILHRGRLAYEGHPTALCERMGGPLEHCFLEIVRDRAS